MTSRGLCPGVSRAPSVWRRSVVVTDRPSPRTRGQPPARRTTSNIGRVWGDRSRVIRSTTAALSSASRTTCGPCLRDGCGRPLASGPPILFHNPHRSSPLKGIPARRAGTRTVSIAESGDRRCERSNCPRATARNELIAVLGHRWFTYPAHRTGKVPVRPRGHLQNPRGLNRPVFEDR